MLVLRTYYIVLCACVYIHAYICIYFYIGILLHICHVKLNATLMVSNHFCLIEAHVTQKINFPE